MNKERRQRRRGHPKAAPRPSLQSRSYLFRCPKSSEALTLLALRYRTPVASR